MRAVQRALILTELLVTLGVLAVLAGILLPLLFQAREKGRQTVCLSYLRQILLAVNGYAHDWDERLPMNAYQAVDKGGQPCLFTLVGALRPFGVSSLAFCPTQPDAFHLDVFLRSNGLTGGECDGRFDGGSFAINVAVFVRGDAPALGWQGTPPVQLSQLTMPVMTVGIYDGNVAGEPRCGFRPFDPLVQGRHLSAANLGFLDGHARAQTVFASGCQVRNINDIPMVEHCVSGKSPYRRRCGEEEEEEVSCVHHFVGLPHQDERGDCVNFP